MAPGTAVERCGAEMRGIGGVGAEWEVQGTLHGVMDGAVSTEDCAGVCVARDDIVASDDDQLLALLPVASPMCVCVCVCVCVFVCAPMLDIRE
jgi:hypothetical protein